MSSKARKQTSPGVTVSIECMTCHAQREVELSPDKFKELSESWKTQETCENCNATTDWTFAQAAVDETEQEDFWDWMAGTAQYFQPETAARQDERRSEPRMEMQVPLHIRSDEGDEEVTSDNISKSGFCFSSALAYHTGQMIKVTLALPGARGSVTKTGTIVRAVATADGRSAFGVRLET